MKLLTYRELGENLSLSVRYLQICVKQGTLPCVRFGKAIRFDPSAIEEWVKKHGTGLSGNCTGAPTA